MGTPWWAWTAFAAVIAVTLGIDLLSLRRRHAPTLRSALLWSAVWIALGAGFTGVVVAYGGGGAGESYLTGYLLEKSLSVDNVAVFAATFAAFGLSGAEQRRVLLYGVIGALAMRAVLIVAGVSLIDRFDWLLLVFGGLLVVTGGRMALHRTARDPAQSRAMRCARRLLPMSTGEHGERFLVRERGRLLATPLLAVLLVIEATDLAFAVDSISAVFSVTQDLFLVVASNAFAVLGLRALYLLVGGAMQSLRYLRVGLAAVLVLAGVKLLLGDVVHLPALVSLGAVAGVVAVAVVASLLAARGGSRVQTTANPARRAA